MAKVPEAESRGLEALGQHDELQLAKVVPVGAFTMEEPRKAHIDATHGITQFPRYGLLSGEQRSGE